MNLIDVLVRHAKARGDAAAMIPPDGGPPVTFAALEGGTRRAASVLFRSGLREGDAVLLFQPPSVDLYTALLAIFRQGMMAVFIDPYAGRGHIERCAALCPLKGFVARPKAHLLRLISPALRRVPVKFSTGLRLPGAAAWRERAVDDAPPDARCETSTPALVTFTSGSTGEPKVVLRSHGFLLAQHDALGAELEQKPGDVVLTTLPIFVLSHLAAGATTVIPNCDLRRPGFVDASPVVDQIEHHRATTVEGSPAFLERIARFCESRGLCLDGLKRIHTGGAPVYPRLLDRLQSVAPNAEVVALYGSTEAEPIARIARREMRPRDIQSMVEGGGLLAGEPVGAISLRILPDRWGKAIGPFGESEFERACLEEDEPGEIVVSGAHVLSGYMDGRGDDETKFSVGGRIWHRTGDAGYLDKDHRLWLLGRCAARVADERGAIYPFAVECAACQNPAVRRSAFLQGGGRRILAVELEPHVRSADLAPLGESLSWASIDDIRICRRLPVDKRHNAKIDYTALHKLFD